MKLLHKIAFALVFALLSISTGAQTAKVTVSGTITDAMGPVPGATVYEKGNLSNGIVSDLDGKYTISVPAKATLVFTCLGYEDIEEVINGRATINVKLEDSFEQLQSAEVVSIGYGSVARRDLTGSVGKVNMDNIIKSTPMNIDQAIAGRVAGVVVTTSDGQIGAEANIIIRGNNSLTQSSAPLYVVDGFPTESSFATAINPADIESVDVLKDASAAAIYGARGANGVIVITTKRGQGQAKVNFNSSWTVGEIANKVDLLNGYEFVRLDDEYCTYELNSQSGFFTGFDSGGGYDYDYYSLEDYENQRYVDWQDKVYRQAWTQNYGVSLNGGNKQSGTRYNVSLSALDQNGILVATNFKRYTGKINFTQEINDKLSLDVIASYARSFTNGTQPASSMLQTTSSSYLLYQIWGFRPIRPLRFGPINEAFENELVDEEISNPDAFRFNPAANVRNQYRKITRDYINANFAVTYILLEGLQFKSSFGYSLSKNTDEAFNGSKTITGHPAFPLGYGPNGRIYWDNATSVLNENTVTYDKSIGNEHHIQALAGFTLQDEKQDHQGVSARQIQSEKLGILGLNTGEYQAVEPYLWEWGMLSGLARLNYNYKYTYYLTASFRADGSSKFPKANRWGFFPSASVAWTFSNEPFVKELGFISNGKIRASWGKTGNNRTSTPYDYYARFLSMPGSNDNMDYVRDGKTVYGYFRANMANEKLKWETTEQTNIGLDLALFDNRITLTTDYYIKNTYDLLLRATLPPSSGYTDAMINIGSMRNRGVEFTLTVVPLRTRHFDWTSTFNIGMNKNTVTGLSMNQTTLISTVNWNEQYSSQVPYVTKVGMPTGLMYGYRYLGTYKLEEFANGTLLHEGIPHLENINRENVRPGDPKYEDINKDGVINDNDRTVIGIGQPLHTGGWNNTLTAYGFDFSVFFNWSYGNDILNANRLVFENYNGTQLNQFGSMRNAFSKHRNPDSDIPRAGARGMDYFSSRVVEDGSFLRLKTITLGYTLPKKISNKIGVSAARIYVTGDNIYTWTNYSGPDPEVSTRNSVLTPGFDWSAYPRAKSFTGGVSLTF